MSLVVFTALVGLSVALGRLSAITAFVALLCIAGGAGAAGALNMWYDADIDAMMTRAAMRPIPRGRVSRPEALTFGLVLAAGSIAVMGLAVNIAAAALLAFTIFFYVIVFTMLLKRYAAEALGYPKEMPVLNDAGDPTEVLALQKTGIDGTQGYLEWLGLNYPRTFATMLGRVLPMQLNIKSRRGSLTLIQWTVRPALSAPAGLFLEVHIYARRRSP